MPTAPPHYLLILTSAWLMSCKSNLKCPSGVKSVSLLRKNINYFINGVQAWRSWSVHVGVMLVFVLLYQSFCITTVVHCLYKNTWNKLCVLKLFSILTKKKRKNTWEMKVTASKVFCSTAVCESYRKNYFREEMKMTFSSVWILALIQEWNKPGESSELIWLRSPITVTQAIL